MIIISTKAQIPTNGLQLHYTFDGNLNDSSGNNYNANAIGTFSYLHSNNPFSTSDSCFKGNNNYQLFHDYNAHPTNFRTKEFSCLR